MTDLIVVNGAKNCDRLKTIILDSVSSPITPSGYNMALNEFIEWFQAGTEGRLQQSNLSAWRASLEARKLGSSSRIAA